MQKPHWFMQPGCICRWEAWLIYLHYTTSRFVRKLRGKQRESHASLENRNPNKNWGITGELSLQLPHRELGAIFLFFAFILTSSNKLKITSTVANNKQAKWIKFSGSGLRSRCTRRLCHFRLDLWREKSWNSISTSIRSDLRFVLELRDSPDSSFS